MGLSGEFSQHPPLSLLFVASALTRFPVKIEILDTRIIRESWKTLILEKLKEPLLFVGFTVMSGTPVAHSLEMSKFIKSHSKVPIVWGGALPTVAAHTCLKEESVDFVVSGSGIQAVQSIYKILSNSEQVDKTKVSGLGYKDGDSIFVNKHLQGFEHVPYQSIPYHLIKDFEAYGQIGSDELVFPIYSAYGCPYQCSFCISPAHYKDFKVKWSPLKAAEVVNHIEFLIKNFKATTIYFYDDDSFVSIEHIRNIINEIKTRNLKIKLSFRGARVNEIMKMDDAFLNDLAETGTQTLHIGVEAGSQRVLDLFNKGIKTSDIIEINRKLAKNKKLIAAYNWIVGTPTETEREIKKTTRLLLQLIKENPRCFVFQPNVFRVVPGAELEKLAIRNGYTPPESIEDWINEETELKKSSPWFTPQMEKQIRMLQVTSYFVDKKADLLMNQKSIKSYLVRLFSALYRPFALFRFKSGWSGFFIEEHLFTFAQKLLKVLK